MSEKVSEKDYLYVMMAKLIDALDRYEQGADGNWGYPSFHAELREMRKSLEQTDALKRYPKQLII